MPRIAPIEWNDLDPGSRILIEEGVQSGMYPAPAAMQVVANSPEALAAMHAGYRAVFRRSALGARLQELIRIRSARLNGCDMCAAARKEESIADEGADCAVDSLPDDPRERAALQLLDMMIRDHHAIDDGVIRELSRHFSAREIIELGWFCGNCIGTHRFMHMLDMVGTEPPIIAAGAGATGA